MPSDFERVRKRKFRFEDFKKLYPSETMILQITDMMDTPGGQCL